ncbi:DNA internalization-related competence protein ComEC/Rec2 [Aneurinibacillus terranovensis]|uniref:DNA internalization-related competence protein ComEC/Rec2 n=1 Tax=Aneurinibacillus terranovensis TaxID=278991 RepID=UPI00040E6B25|nr:DNA internalization-related competence protein ComEC/Rec2 [Aneurinibacillus terranovensis]
MKCRILFCCSVCALGGMISAAAYYENKRFILLCLSVFILGAAIILWKQPTLRRPFIVGACFFLIGGSNYMWTEAHNTSHLPLGRVSFEGIIQDAPDFDGDRSRFTLQIAKINNRNIPQAERVWTTVYFTTEEQKKRAEACFLYHSRLKGEMELNLPKPPTNPGAFNYPVYLHREHIHRVGSIRSPQSLSYQKPNRSIEGAILSLQKWLVGRINRMYSADTAGFISGLLIGSLDEMDAENYVRLSSLGLAHILAISGHHITLLVIGLLFLLRWLGMTKERAGVLAIILLPLYVLLTGAGASAVRALIMGELVLLAVLLHRFKDGWNLIGAAFLMMTLFDPYQIHSISFQLSYLVTFGLLAFVPLLDRKVAIKWKFLRENITVTAAATLVSFPLSIFYFHLFSFLSPLVNFIFVPFSSILIMPTAAVSLILGSIHPAFGILLARIVDFMLAPVLQLLYKIENWKWLSFAFVSPSFVWFVVYAGWLVFLAFLLYGKIETNWKTITASFLSCFLLLLALFIPQWMKKGTQITFLDVGQGDAIVIETPRRVVLIDGGGSPAEKEGWKRQRNPYQPIKNVVIPYLLYRGISSVDLYVMTHGDSDHVGGSPYLLLHMPVKQILANGLPPKTQLEQEIARVIKERGIPVVTAQSGQRWREEEGINLDVLNPPISHEKDEAASDNNNSVVLLLDAYQHHFLFTGDLEKEREDRLLQDGRLPSVDVLKVGHHGSKSSTGENWVSRLHPLLSVISVGERNRYGHPNPEVIRRLEAHHSTVLRTDKQGAVIINVNNHEFTYTTVK